MFEFKSSQGIQCGLVVYSWGAEALCLRACHVQTILALHEIIVCGKQEAAPVLQPRYGVEHEIVLVAPSSTRTRIDRSLVSYSVQTVRFSSLSRTYAA